MPKIHCEECDTTSTITGNTQEPITFCPFCGEQVVYNDGPSAEDDDEDDEEEDDEEDGWDDDEDD